MTHLIYPGDNLMFEPKVVEENHNDTLPLIMLHPSQRVVDQ